MRVLWVSKGLGPGGAEHLLLAVARATNADDVAYESAYLLPWKQHLVPALEAAGVRTHLLDGARDFDPRWMARLRRLIVDGRFDVVHAHSPAPAAATRVVVRSIPRASRPRMVTTEHNVWTSYRFATRAATWLTYALDDDRVAVADAVRDSLPDGIARRTDTLVHGIDVAEVRRAAGDRERIRAELGIPAAAPVAATLANLRVDKDYPTLLAAAELALAAVPDGHWLAAGQGPLADEIGAAVRSSDGLDRFHLLGHRADPWSVLAAADLLVVGSQREGLPVAVMEALALGRPVVSTAVGGIPELVRHDVEGLLVPPSRPAELADAVVSVMTDDAMRSRLAAAARDRAASIDVGRAADALRDRYAALLRTTPQ